MANYIVSYDLNGATPTHAEMDEHLQKVGWAWGRVLETVWYVGTDEPIETVFNHVGAILSQNDRLLVVLASEALWHNLLVGDDSLTSAWKSSR